MIFPQTVPILEDDEEDFDVQVSLTNDGEVESIKYNGSGYGYAESARVSFNDYFQQPAVGWPYSHSEWETTKHFRNGEGRGAVFKEQQLRLERARVIEKKQRLERERIQRTEAQLQKERLEKRRAIFLGSFRDCRGVRDSPVESLLLKATYRRKLEGSERKADFVGENLWGFTDPRSFEFLRNEGEFSSLMDFVRLPPDKHDKLKKLCYDGDVAVSRDVWCTVDINGIAWRYEIRLEFRQYEDRYERFAEFYIVDEIGIDAYLG